MGRPAEPGPLTSPEFRRIVELLSDGQWHDFHRIIDQAGRVVEPGRAVRTIEAARKTSGMGTAVGQQRPSERVREIDHDRAVLYGQRECARRAVRSTAWFQIDPPGRVPPGTQKRIRLRPIEQEERSGTEDSGSQHL